MKKGMHQEGASHKFIIIHVIPYVGITQIRYGRN